MRLLQEAHSRIIPATSNKVDGPLPLLPAPMPHQESACRAVAERSRAALQHLRLLAQGRLEARRQGRGRETLQRTHLCIAGLAETLGDAVRLDLQDRTSLEWMSEWVSEGPLALGEHEASAKQKI